jgi:integrase
MATHETTNGEGAQGAHARESGTLVAEVKVGSVSVLVRHAPVTVQLNDHNAEAPQTEPTNGSQAKTYDSYQIVYYEGSRRKIVRRNTPDKAKQRAKEIATRLSRLGPQADHLGEKDRRIYILARNTVQPLGLPVDEVCRRYVELRRRLKEGTLEQAVDFKNNHGQGVQDDILNKDLYELYIADREKRGVGEYHMRDTKRYIGGFIAKFPIGIGKITTAQIDAYLGAIGGGANNKNHHRDAIIAYYNFARDKGYLPYGMPHAAERTTEFRDARKRIESEQDALKLLQPTDIYTPEEARKILAVADEPLLMPTLEIKMLSGVRTEEIVRLWWVMIAENEGLIRIPDPVGKIDARRVPILPALARRLKNIAAEIKHDRVAAEWSIANSLYHAWKRVCKKAGVPYRRNAFRNSYFTYRLAIVGNPQTVAEEGGTSKEMLEKNYLSRAPVSRAMADEWFAL